jgi:Cu2+-exporting ATPase
VTANIIPGCCAPGVPVDPSASDLGAVRTWDDSAIAADPAAYVQRDEEGVARLHMMVEGIHCPACAHTIEAALKSAPGVLDARVNMTTRRLVMSWREGLADPVALMRKLGGLGYRLVPYDPARLAAEDAREDNALLRAMAVAGFAAANIMLLSVAVWAGAFEGMGPATRGLFYWISALIALPAVAYAGRPFFRSALGALTAGRLNMDVPISLAVLLAVGMSLVETARGGEHAYFDAAVALLFFLLVGRYLDRRARARARSAAEHLLGLMAMAATVIDEDGRRRSVPADQVAGGMVLAVAAGERLAADGEIIAGRSDLDCSLVTGEATPEAAQPGRQVFAGTLNLTGPLQVRVTAAGEGTLLAEIVRLMEAAEQGRARYVRLADRLARIYAPAVHALGALTFLGWWLIGGLNWQAALLTAVAVLIITCPCALGLAVPAVQVVAGGRLLRRGVLLKSPDGLERLAAIERVVFDKTGTLTLGRPRLVEGSYAPEDLRLAASLAVVSRHPLARALCRLAPDVPAAAGVREFPGQGLVAGEVRLGSARWCAVEDAPEPDGPELWLTRPGHAPVRFCFVDQPREDAGAVIAGLRRRGLAVELISGDRAPTVARLADELGIARWRAECSPLDKAAHLTAAQDAGVRVLMVGDGLNDAPALAAASASASPATAADISQTAADVVFQGARLAPLLEALDVARKADRLVKQNFTLALVYNALAVPLAMAGLVTPLFAALAMSASSLMVIANSLRLRGGRLRGGT